MMLIIWEIVININSNLNLAILYTFIGEFEKAEQALNTKWLLLYVPPYIFGIWDARRLTYDLNKFATFAELSNSTIARIKISPLEINTLVKRHPSLAVIWSSLMPGLGHLYINRLPDGFFLIMMWVICCILSNVLQAIHLTFMGNFTQATNIVNPSWLLFMPSLYSFTIYDAYVNCVEYNRELLLLKLIDQKLTLLPVRRLTVIMTNETNIKRKRTALFHVPLLQQLHQSRPPKISWSLYQIFSLKKIES